MIFVTGPSASGKSAIVKELSDRRGLAAADLDEQIEKECGMSIDNIFNKHGEAYFRKKESEFLKKMDAQIIACGGGTITDPANIRWMKQHGKIILLIATPTELLRRLSSDNTRPLLSADRDTDLRKMLGKRAHAYCDADYLINTTECTIQEAADLAAEFICRK